VLAAPDDLTPRTIPYVARAARAYWLANGRHFRISKPLAASLLLALGVGAIVSSLVSRDRDQPPKFVTRTVPVELHSIGQPPRDVSSPPTLDRALADATSATWDLARSASEPAARIGREMLDATARTGDPAENRPTDASAAMPPGTAEALVDLSVSVPSLDALGSDAIGASRVIEQVGDQLSAGVQPLSSTARHAFGFLLGSPPARAGARPGGTTSSGARSG
jgi:hypothetical protein